MIVKESAKLRVGALSCWWRVDCEKKSAKLRGLQKRCKIKRVGH